MSEREPTLQDVLAAVGELRGQVEALGELREVGEVGKRVNANGGGVGRVCTIV